MLGDLSKKNALVTGGGAGIGRGIVIVLAQQGADVAIGDINLENASTVAKEVEALGRKTLPVRLDVTSRESANQAVSDVLAAWDHLDILVNNAGVVSAPGTPPGGDDREEDWDTTFNTNVKGVVHCCEAVIPHFKDRQYGKIINISSTAGRNPRPVRLSYRCSKAAVNLFTSSLALKLSPYNINVNGIGPGMVWTAFHWQMMTDFQKQGATDYIDKGFHEFYDLFIEKNVNTMVPLKREQTPEDIGKMVAFLASEDARNITGQTIHVDGGLTMF
jgi:NAD(P)-dependent dehydrogenase (short-subunit alcohol dehydrogenase family)